MRVEKLLAQPRDSWQGKLSAGIGAAAFSEHTFSSDVTPPTNEPLCDSVLSSPNAE
jgi:hypothetical protein